MLEIQKTEYDLRFAHFLEQIISVGKMKPREKYLYPIMNGVPFQDLEVALMMAQAAFSHATNDNKKA